MLGRYFHGCLLPFHYRFLWMRCSNVPSSSCHFDYVVRFILWSFQYAYLCNALRHFPRMYFFPQVDAQLDAFGTPAPLLNYAIVSSYLRLSSDFTIRCVQCDIPSLITFRGFVHAYNHNAFMSSAFTSDTAGLSLILTRVR